MDTIQRQEEQGISIMKTFFSLLFGLLCISSGLSGVSCMIPDINEFNELVMDTNKSQSKTRVRTKQDNTSPKIKVGLCLPEWEKRRLSFPARLGENYGVVVKDIDMEQSIEEQGPFDVIFHKILKWFDKDTNKGKSYLNKLLGYISEDRDVQLIDPIENGIKLANRSLTLEIAKHCEFTYGDKRVFVPKFVYVQNNNAGINKKAMRSAGIQYPVISKRQAANKGLTESHKMQIVFSEENLKDLEPPCVVQEFRNHGGKMFKIYVIGDKYYTCEKPSVKNLRAGEGETLFFDSTNITKGEYFPKLHESDPNYISFETSDEKELLDQGLVVELISKLRSVLNFNILGVDVIIDEETGDYGIVDLNYSPSFNCVLPHLHFDLVQLFVNISRSKGLKSRI